MPQLLPGDRPSESSRRFLRHGLSAATLLGVGILVLVFAQTGGAAPASVTGYHEGCSDPTVTKTLAPALMAAEFNPSKPKTVTVTRTKTKTVTTTRTATKVRLPHQDRDPARPDHHGGHDPDGDPATGDDDHHRHAHPGPGHADHDDDRDGDHRRHDDG